MKVLDLYAGTGSVGMDLLSRGAAYVDFVEINRSRAQKISEELRARSMTSKASIHRIDAIKVMARLTGNSYDLVFADPPYEIAPWEEIIKGLQRNDLLEPDAWLIAEHSSRTPMADEICGAIAINRKRYGDSSITIYAFSDCNPSGQR